MKGLLSQLAWCLVVLSVVLVFIYPLLWMLLGVFKGNSELFDASDFFPESFSPIYLKKLLFDEVFPFWRGFFVSMFVSVTTAVFSVALSLGAAFAVFQSRTKAMFLAIGFSLVVVAFPPTLVAVGHLLWASELQMVNSVWGVIAPSCVSGLGVVFFIFCFRSIPADLLRYALMEGAGGVRTFLLATRLISPAVVSFFFVQFVLTWHEQFLALLLISTSEFKTLPLYLASLSLNDLRMPQAIMLGGVLAAIVPPVAFFLLALPSLRGCLKDLHSD